MAFSFLRFLDHTQRHTTVGRTPLDKWSARRRDLYLTKHNTYNRQTSVPPVGFEPKIPAGERPQTHALDRAATGIGRWLNWCTELEDGIYLRAEYSWQQRRFTAWVGQWATVWDYCHFHWLSFDLFWDNKSAKFVTLVLSIKSSERGKY
jgi:hypothetical protein